jgi:hypothetical protein
VVSVAAVPLVLVLALSASSPRKLPQPVLRRQPSYYIAAADYTTVRFAETERDRLLRDPNYRHKIWGAYVALLILTTSHLHIAPGQCAAAVEQLYANLLDLHDAAKGEDFRPLAQLVQREPRVEAVCRPTQLGLM